MSGASIDRKIAKGNAKAGKVLGYLFDQFRPDNYVSPMSLENRHATIQAAWSEDKQFQKNPEETLTHFNVYADHRKLAVGDILKNSTIGRTFIITEINQLRGAVAVQAPEVMTVQRAVYDVNATDKATSFRTMYTDVPCAVEYKSGHTDSSVLPSGGSTQGTRSQIEIWTWMPVASMQVNDAIDVLGNRFNITGLRQDQKGTVILARSTSIGK